MRADKEPAIPDHGGSEFFGPGKIYRAKIVNDPWKENL